MAQSESVNTLKSSEYFAFILGDLGNGGQEKQLLYLTLLFRKNNFNVTVFVWNMSDQNTHYNNLIRSGINVICFDQGTNLLKKIFAIRKELKRHPYKFLHSFAFYVNFYTWLSCFGLKTIPVGAIRTRMILHFTDTGKILGGLCSWLPFYKISNNHLFADDFKNPILRRRLRNTFIVPNHLDINNFHVSKSGDNVHIKTVSVGRLYSEKRIDLLIPIIKNALQSGADIVHYHAGEGALEADIRAGIKEAGIEKNFILCGNINNIDAFLSDKDIFIHTADYEGYPNVIMEAMACGKPIITTNCGDVTFMIKNNVNGFITEKGDIEALTSKLIYLYHNPEICRAFGAESRRIAERMFNLKHLFQTTVDVYSKISNYHFKKI